MKNYEDKLISFDENFSSEGAKMAGLIQIPKGKYMMDFFSSEDLYIKLNEFLNYVGYAERQLIIKFSGFRIEKLTKGKNVFYLVINELGEEIYLVNDDKKKVERLWNETVNEVREKIEKETGKRFTVFNYANTLILVERRWWEEKDADLLRLVKGFTYKESKEIAGMITDVLQRGHYVRIDVPVDYLITSFTEKIRKEFKRW